MHNWKQNIFSEKLLKLYEKLNYKLYFIQFFHHCSGPILGRELPRAYNVTVIYLDYLKAFSQSLFFCWFVTETIWKTFFFCIPSECGSCSPCLTNNSNLHFFSLKAWSTAQWSFLTSNTDKFVQNRNVGYVQRVGAFTCFPD